ncbi:MAG: N-acetylmuramoyl-L-alanine amidase [Endomicrobium sp.]|jgi:N-acetylmuramoyl-L-alanine amidase|nr:N-acetylmuramoyl-L-alanine amidase [Endomicrobium sp.]
MIKKKFVVLFFSLLTIFFSVYLYAENKTGTPSKETIDVFIDGEPFLGMSVYRVFRQTDYFSIKEIAKMYNAVLEWKPVSSQVTMHLNNSKIDVKANSTRVVLGREEKKMSLPSRFIDKDIYVPLEFLTSREFVEIARADTVWDSPSSVLKITHHLNVLSVKYFTMPEGTQIVVQLEAPLSYDVLKSSEAVVIKISGGIVRHDLIHVNNGVIKDITCGTEEGKYALIKINLQQPPKLIRASLLSRPSRISVDITHSKNLDSTGSDLEEKTVVIVKPEKEFESAAPDKEVATAVVDTTTVDIDLTPHKNHGEAQIDEITPLIENDEDNKDLEKIPVVKFENDNIVDDSPSIIDDTQDAVAEATFKQQKDNKRKKKIIVLDAGHGGEDAGAVGPNGVKEKKVSLSIVYELKALFDKNEDYEIILTRKDDTFISLPRRINIANDSKADLFISVHCNANLKREINSFEVYVFSDKATDPGAAATEILENSVLEIEKVHVKNRPMVQSLFWSLGVNRYLNESLELCGFIVRETKQKLMIPSRDPKQANFYVLRGTTYNMPAVLVESAYISNYAQEANFVAPGNKFVVAIANSVYEGVVKYYANKDKKQNYK